METSSLYTQVKIEFVYSAQMKSKSVAVSKSVR